MGGKRGGVYIGAGNESLFVGRGLSNNSLILKRRIDEVDLELVTTDDEAAYIIFFM